MRSQESHMAPVVNLAFSRDGRALATLQGHPGAVMSVAFRADGSLIISGSLDGTIRLWGIAP